MRSFLPRQWSLLLAVAWALCAQSFAQAPSTKQQLQKLLGSNIRSSGAVTVSASGDGGKAVVTIRTTTLVGSCTSTCPSTRAVQAFGESSTTAVPVVERIAVSIDGQRLFVPRLVYSGMYQPDFAKLIPEGSGFVLRIYGSDAASAYSTRIYFDTTGIQHMVDTYECGTGEETHFLRFAEDSLEHAAPASAHGAVQRALRKPGQTKIALRTKTHRVSAIVRLMPLESACAASCPDATILSKGNSRQPVFTESVKLFFDGKQTPSRNSSLSGEGIRNATPLYGTTVDPRQVSLRAEGSRFVLRIEGGEGATANFEEFLFDSQGVQQSVVSESAGTPIAVTDFYPVACGP